MPKSFQISLGSPSPAACSAAPYLPMPHSLQHHSLVASQNTPGPSALISGVALLFQLSCNQEGTFGAVYPRAEQREVAEGSSILTTVG